MKDCTMKKTMIFAAFAALVSLASCQKEEVIDNNGTGKNASPVFTASIAGSTKTTVDLTDGKVAWEEADEITITDALSKSAVYKIESIDATTGKATFVIKDGETALGDGPYTATYGTEPSTSQTYSATAGKLYMTAPETSNNSFTFTVQCGLMKLNLTKTGESVKSIAVTGGTDATYTLTCDPAQSIATAKDFCIALPAGSYTKIEITNAEDITCTLNSASGVAVAANHIKPVTFREDKLNFAPAVPDGALPGVFSVSDTKKVYFSKGNLYYDGSALNFEANQSAFNSSYESSHVSLFTWSSTVADAVGESSNGDNLFCDENNKVSVHGSEAIYYALSTEEWQYLFNNHSKKWATVNGVNGYVIAPDGFEETLAASYADDAALAADNLVFLPAAGFREGSDVYAVGDYGYYWSSSADKEKRYSAYVVIFNSDNVSPDVSDDRDYGYSVRLITESK